MTLLNGGRSSFGSASPAEALRQGEPATRARWPDAEGFAEHGGVRVGWELYEGPEPTVLFVSQPALTHARGLKNVVPYLSRHFRVVVVDGPGNGRADRPRDPAAYAPEALVGYALAVLDATGTERAIPISWSPRAIVALKLCVAQPERIIAAVFVTPDLWPTDFFVKPFTAAPKESYADEEVFNPHLMRTDWPGFLERWARRAHPHPHSTRQIENWVSYGLDTDGETFITSLLGTRLPEREEALALARQVSCPTLVLRNGGLAVGPKEASGAFAEAAGSKLHVFVGLGPAVASRWPVIFNIVVRNYLESVRSGTAPRPLRPEAATR